MRGQNHQNQLETFTSDFADSIAPVAIIQAVRVIGTTVIDDVPHILMPFTGKCPRLDSKRDKYEFPGGKQDPEESLAQTAIRETFEETGMFMRLTSPGYYLGTKKFTYKNGSPYNDMSEENFVFTAVPRVNTTPRPSSEHERVDWLPLDYVIRNALHSTEFREGTFSTLAAVASIDSSFRQNLTETDLRILRSH